jgi:hypothetical protein
VDFAALNLSLDFPDSFKNPGNQKKDWRNPINKYVLYCLDFTRFSLDFTGLLFFGSTTKTVFCLDFPDFWISPRFFVYVTLSTK